MTLRILATVTDDSGVVTGHSGPTPKSVTVARDTQ